MLRQDVAPLCVSLSEMQAYVRVETGQEEAVIAGLLRVASDVCETFISQALVDRSFEINLTAGEGWSLVGLQPVRTISSISSAEIGIELDPDTYRADIDHDGRAFLRGLQPGVRYVVRGRAGMGTEANHVPEPLRQGILRYAAFLFANRDGAAGEIPSAVTTLWRPYRKAGLCR